MRGLALVVDLLMDDYYRKENLAAFALHIISMKLLCNSPLTVEYQ